MTSPYLDDSLVVTPEENNANDPFAIGVYTSKGTDRILLGHLPIKLVNTFFIS